MPDTPHDWTRFRRRVFVKAPLREVFEAWACPSRLTTWFIRTAEGTDAEGAPRDPDEIVRAGDRYHWRWHQDLETSGRFLEVVPDERLAFTFGSAGEGPEGEIRVTVVFEQQAGETTVELTQENMPDTPAAHVGWYTGCNMGWSFFMTNLKALLEHGVDLRETDPERAMASRAITC